MITTAKLTLVNFEHRACTHAKVAQLVESDAVSQARQLAIWHIEAARRRPGQVQGRPYTSGKSEEGAAENWYLLISAQEQEPYRPSPRLWMRFLLASPLYVASLTATVDYGC